MALSSSNHSSNLSLKVLLISVAIVSVALAIPLMFRFAMTGLPVIWSVIISYLKPPYLFLLMNGIIITIAACTRFQQNHHQEVQENQSQSPVNYTTPNTPPLSDPRSDLPPVANPPSFDISPVTYGRSVTVEPPVVYESKLADLDLESVSGQAVVEGDKNEFVSTTPSQSVTNSLPSTKKLQPALKLPAKEKELIMSRFASNRKSIKSSPEGARALRVLKPKKHETLETTWKTITDGRHMPLTRHFKKSDTFSNLHRDRPSEDSLSPANPKVVKKSETFKDRTEYANQNDYPQPSAENSSMSKLKKDVSLSQDELNRRVEAFIKKFNDDMRLQRQESLKKYMEMVKGGAR